MSWQPKDADWKLPQCEVEQANLPKIACLYYTYFRFTVSYKHVQTRKKMTITNISCFLAMPWCPHLAPPASEVMDEVLNFTAFRIPGAAQPQWWMDGSQTGWGNEELFKERWNDEMMHFTYWFYVYIYIHGIYMYILSYMHVYHIYFHIDM